VLIVARVIILMNLLHYKMKKQNKTNRLAFKKAAVLELNTVELNQVNGGTNTQNGLSQCICDPVISIVKAIEALQ
jgi:hypothetical protein